MIDALVSGKLIRESTLKTGKSGNFYCNILLSVAVGDSQNIVVSGIAFGTEAEKIVKLGKGDALSVCGSLKPTEYTDKDGQIKNGLNVTVSSTLSVYDIVKRRAKPDNAVSKSDNAPRPFDDDINS